MYSNDRFCLDRGLLQCTSSRFEFLGVTSTSNVGIKSMGVIGLKRGDSSHKSFIQSLYSEGLIPKKAFYFRYSSSSTNYLDLGTTRTVGFITIPLSSGNDKWSALLRSNNIGSNSA
jgi:hypothetical protein